MDHENTSNSSDTLDTSRSKVHNYPPNELVAAPSAPGDDSSDEKSICRKCRPVDWDSLASQGEHLQRSSMPIVARYISAGVSHEQLATSSCKICRILSVVKPRSLDDTECIVRARSLSAFSGAYAMPDSWPMCKTTALHVSRRDTIPRENMYHDKCLAVIRRDSLDFGSRTITSRLIDYDWLRRLVQSCEEDHVEFCGSSSLGPVSGLKVIEASSWTVIEAPATCRYVALSYVWGKQPDFAQDGTSHLQNPPPLIEDALSVTLAMGYKYLWVDRYCIPQTDNQERHRMINQMGQVYANAALTIIDASGGDAQSGLPGISSFRRPQRCVYIRNTAILELPCGQDELNCSKWATRGWTYQEGFFSKRRLIFTPSQILFLCNGTCVEESTCQLSQQLVMEPNAERFSRLINANCRYVDKKSHLNKLKEYSKRDLTYSNDSLNAFLGVLNFEVDTSRRSDPILHVSCGLVVQGGLHKNVKLRIYLNWYHEAPAERRPEFPTWSWAGWGGPLEFHWAMEGFPLQYRKTAFDPGTPSLSQFDWEISWESRDHKPVVLREFAKDYLSTAFHVDKLQSRQQPDYPKRLEITCFVVPVRFQVVSLTESERSQETDIKFEKTTKSKRVGRRGLPTGTESVAVLQFVTGVHIATKAYLDQDLHLQDCIIGLMSAEGSSLKISIGCLLARQLTEGVYERVGALPSLVLYHSSEGFGLTCFPQSVFLDDTGSILNEVRVSAAQEESLFSGIGERRTLFLE